MTAVCLAGQNEKQTFETMASWTGLWVTRGPEGEDAAKLIDALEAHPFPPEDGFIFIAAESSIARQLRMYCVERRGHPLSFMKASGYWKRGMADAHAYAAAFCAALALPETSKTDLRAVPSGMM